MKKILTALLCLALLLGFISCGEKATDITTAVQTQSLPETDAKTETPTEAPTEVPTEAPTEAPAEAPTEAVTDPPKPENRDGMMIYYEDFESYGDINGAENVAAALKWDILSAAEGEAPNGWTAELYLKDGELIVENYSDQFDGTDSYAMILNDEYMRKAVEYGKYTLQYDVTYTAASNFKRYINIVTEYNADSYNSFIYRICGYGNNQCYCYGSWYTYDSNYENDAFAAQKKMTETNTTIAYKLLGIESDVGVEDAINNFKDVTVTVRVCRDSKAGCTIYMKTAEMPDFVLVSLTDEYSEGYDYIEELTGRAVCFKAGGKINGRMDNIALWLGFTDMPEDKTVTYNP